MATLFLARRRGAAGFSRHVAIKVVHPHLSDDASFVRMFIDEALLSARIEHPNVVHVIELGEERGMYFLAMEYVHGCTLAQLHRALVARGRTLSVPAAVAICMQIADGLHAAHETTGDDGQPLGVVHRDVSPQNVLVSFRGFVKLIDFGIAKSRGRQQTATGTLKGKLRYMAPEQATGRAVDRRTDLYALGIVLWELLTGRRLFDGSDDFAVLEKVRAPHVVGPREIVPSVPEALDRVVLAALAPGLDDRPASVQAWRDALAAAVPEATSVSSSDIAAVLAEAMPEEIARQTALLPDSVTRDLPDLGSRERDELTRSRFATLTEARAGVAVDVELDEPVAPVPSGGAWAAPAPREVETARRARRWRVLGAIAAITALVGGVLVGAVLLRGAPSAVASEPIPELGREPSSSGSGSSGSSSAESEGTGRGSASAGSEPADSPAERAAEPSLAIAPPSASDAAEGSPPPVSDVAPETLPRDRGHTHHRAHGPSVIESAPVPMHADEAAALPQPPPPSTLPPPSAHPPPRDRLFDDI